MGVGATLNGVEATRHLGLATLEAADTVCSTFHGAYRSHEGSGSVEEHTGAINDAPSLILFSPI